MAKRAAEQADSVQRMRDALPADKPAHPAAELQQPALLQQVRVRLAIKPTELDLALGTLQQLSSNSLDKQPFY